MQAMLGKNVSKVFVSGFIVRIPMLALQMEHVFVPTLVYAITVMLEQIAKSQSVMESMQHIRLYVQAMELASPKTHVLV